MCPAAGATNRRIRSRPRRVRSRPASPARIAAGKPLPGAPLGYPMGPEDLILDDDGKPAAHRQGVFVGSADRRARADAPVDPQRLEGRPVPDRHAVHVHGQHGVELGDEHPRDPAHADRQGPGDRRVQDPAHHLFRRLLLGDGGLCRPDPARHDLFRAVGLHLAARPADRRRRTVPAIRSASRSSSPIATCGRSRTC